MSDPADPEVPGPAGTTDGPAAESIIDVLTGDHRDIEQLLDIATSVGRRDTETRILQRLVSEIVRHFVAEEQYLYPIVRERLEGGAAIAEAGFDDHRSTERTLRIIERRTSTDDEIRSALAVLSEQFRGHVRAQEDELFDQIVALLPEQDLRRLGDEVLGAEQVSPTRPRAMIAESASLNKMTTLVEGFVDRLRDVFTGSGGRSGA